MALSAAVAVAAGCGAGGGSTTGSTNPVPPDRLAVTLRGGGAPDFRVDLACAVADREACAAILKAVADAQSDDHCAAAPTGGPGIVVISGTIDGDPVRSRLARRTDCEIRTYDRVVAALSL